MKTNEKASNNATPAKASVYNLIILDESGSMSDVTRATIDGCNETISTIKATQAKFADTQRHYVSIFAFQSGTVPSRYILKNVPAEEVTNITEKDYEPCGCTPLYDAVGSTLSDLKVITKDDENAVGSVTIITDGMENSSERYTHAQVRNMIAALKEIGWNFNFIGANIDVDRVADSLNIDNRISFRQDDEGTREMFRCERNSKMAYMERLDMVFRSVPTEARRARLRDAAADYYEAPDDDSKE